MPLSFPRPQFSRARAPAKGMKNLSFEKSDVLVYLRAREKEIATVVLDPPSIGSGNQGH